MGRMNQGEQIAGWTGPLGLVLVPVAGEGAGDIGVLNSEEIKEGDSFLPHLCSHGLDLDISQEYSQRFDLCRLGIKVRVGVTHCTRFGICSP